MKTTLPLLGVCRIIRQEATPMFHARLRQIQQRAQAAFDSRKREIRKEWEARAAGWTLSARITQLEWELRYVRLGKGLLIFSTEVEQMRNMVV